MTHAAATADTDAAARGQRFSGRPLRRAGHVLAVTAAPARSQPTWAGCSTRSAAGMLAGRVPRRGLAAGQGQ